MGDLDGDGAAELCARGDDGMSCWGWDGTAFVQRVGPEWSDALGWGAGGQYYQTIRLADFDGDGRADLCARASAGWRCAPSTGDAFAAEVAIEELTDEGGWSWPAFAMLGLIAVLGRRRTAGRARGRPRLDHRPRPRHPRRDAGRR